VLYTVRLFSLSLVNMPITTWGMNALDDKVINHGTSENNMLGQGAGSLGTAVIVSVTTMVRYANTEPLGPVQADMLGINVAFAISGVLCLIGLVLVVLFVKDKPSDAAEIDPDNARRSMIESIMKRDVYFVPAEATVGEAVKLFVEKGISA